MFDACKVYELATTVVVPTRKGDPHPGPQIKKIAGVISCEKAIPGTVAGSLILKQCVGC